jgi:serine protease Do
VGINTAIFSPSGGSVGIGFDIPADVAASVTHQLIENGKVTRGYIGATIQSLTPDLADSLGLKSAKGAIVDQLTAGGPAEQAGLKSGDIVVSVNGHDVQSAADLTRQIALAHPGEDIDLGVMRGAETRQVAIRSGLRPSEASLASNAPQGGDDQGSAGPAVLGLQLAPDAKSGGLMVQGVDPNSDAAAKGLRPGDVILRAGVRPVQSAADVAQAASDARHDGRKSVPLLVARGGQHIYVPVQIEGAAKG